MKVHHILGLALVFMGVCQARVVLVIGTRTDGRGSSPDYFLADARCVEDGITHSADGTRHDIPDDSVIELEESVNLVTVEDHWRSGGRWQELEAHGAMPDGVLNSAGDTIRVVSHLWMPIGASADEKGQAWLEGARLLLAESKRAESKLFQDILAAGALLIAEKFGDMYVEFSALGMLDGKEIIFDDYAPFTNDSFEEGASPVLLLNFARRGNIPGLCLMDGNLVRQICAHRCLIELHSSGVFGVATTWLDEMTIRKGAIRANGICYVSDKTSRKWVRKGEKIPKGVMGPLLWVPKDHAPLISSLWAKAGPLCDSLGDAALLANREDTASVFRGWECAVRETMEKAAREKRSTVVDTRIVEGLGGIVRSKRKGRAKIKTLWTKKAAGTEAAALLLPKPPTAPHAGAGVQQPKRAVLARRALGFMKKRLGRSGGAARSGEGVREPLLAGNDGGESIASSVSASPVSPPRYMPPTTASGTPTLI
ncbi:MAG: hypothetical protein PVJ92_02280 [Candidatus Dependentiae bacterium]|jgi:hypothetical protein